jgi:glycosyltransferase involved in cell wall biosynthesis
VGRLAPEKNWETLLQAVAKAYARHPDLRLVLIGDGPSRESLQGLASELGIAERVTFTGSIPFGEIPSYLKAADFFSFASVTETQGLATMEAMAAGLPIVAVDGSGTRDIAEHGKEGFLVENDPDALAKGIDDLLSDPRRMEHFSKHSLQRAKDFDVNQLSKQMIGVYEQAIEDKKENRTVTLNAEESTEAISSPQAPG